MDRKYYITKPDRSGQREILEECTVCKELIKSNLIHCFLGIPMCDPCFRKTHRTLDIVVSHEKVKLISWVKSQEPEIIRKKN